MLFIHPLSIILNRFTTFAPASRFIAPTFIVGEESPGNAGRRAS